MPNSAPVSCPKNKPMTITNDLATHDAERPFAATAEKYNAEHAKGTVTGSNFPYHKVRDLPGYTSRSTPGLAAIDVTNELARHLVEYAGRSGCSLPYRRREISHYLWWQASRGTLAWEDILKVVRQTRKRDRQKPRTHYFGYSEVMGLKGSARKRTLIKLIRYITQEGECAGCRTEFQFSDLTLDRKRPGKANGTYKLLNVQLMCQPCNGAKGASYSQ